MAFDAASSGAPAPRRASAGAFAAAAASSAGAAGSASAASSSDADSLAGLARLVWTMSQSAASVESLSAGLGGPSDTASFRSRIEGHERAALALQAEIEGGLRRLRVALLAGTDHTAQRQLKRLEEQYAEARERLARALGDSRIRRRQFAPAAAPIATAASAAGRGGGGGGGGAGGAGASGAAAATGPQQVQLEMLQGLSAVDAAIMEERSQEAMAIARASSALQKTQQDLSALVTEQGETVAQVEAGVEKAVEGIVAGTRVLVEAQAYQSNVRWKCACAALLVAVLAAAIAVPLALHYSPGSAIL